MIKNTYEEIMEKRFFLSIPQMNFGEYFEFGWGI
jgi:hypothetical protein